MRAMGSCVGEPPGRRARAAYPETHHSMKLDLFPKPGTGPLVVDVDSSIPDQLRYSGFATRGPLLWTAERLERSARR